MRRSLRSGLATASVGLALVASVVVEGATEPAGAAVNCSYFTTTSSANIDFLYGHQGYGTYWTANGYAPLTWTRTAGTLPLGLTFFEADGNAAGLKGTPLQSGKFPINLEVRDANGCTATLSGEINVYGNASDLLTSLLIEIEDVTGTTQVTSCVWDIYDVLMGYAIPIPPLSECL